MFSAIATTASQTIQKLWLSKGWFSSTLLPLSKLAEYIAKKKRYAYLSGQKKSYKAPVPVIVIGNIFIGGTGKTPLTLALVEALKEKGHRPGIISRGYGATLKDDARFADLSTTPHTLPKQANLSTLSTFIGDEPSLLAKVAPIAVHPQRQKAIECLLANRPNITVILSDDGLQHYAMARDIEIVVQDSRGIGNGLMLPAGPLREPASRLTSVDFIVTNDTTLFEQAQTSMLPVTGQPREVYMHLALVEFEHLQTGQKLSLDTFKAKFSHLPISAIAGIGHPQRFFQSLRRIGLSLIQTQSFADHYAFRPEDFRDYTQGLLLMTSKDAAKCQGFAQSNWWVAHVKAQFKPTHFFEDIYQQLPPLTH